jgi:hypothetical protein
MYREEFRQAKCIKHRKIGSETDPEIPVPQIAASFHEKLDIVMDMQESTTERSDFPVRSVLPTRELQLHAVELAISNRKTTFEIERYSSHCRTF